jgi:hypothetical protein
MVGHACSHHCLCNHRKCRRRINQFSVTMTHSNPPPSSAPPKSAAAPDALGIPSACLRPVARIPSTAPLTIKAELNRPVRILVRAIPPRISLPNDETQPGRAKGDRLYGGRYSALAGVTGWALSSANPPLPDRISQTGGASKHTKKRGDFVHFAPPQKTPEIGVTGGSSPCRAESVKLDRRAIGAQYIINNHDRFT